MRRIPEIVVLLCLPLVTFAVYLWHQVVYWENPSYFHVGWRGMLIRGDRRRLVWESVPGPVRDVVTAGWPGWLLAALAVALLTRVVLTLRWPLASSGQFARRIAILAALVTIAGGSFGLAEFHRNWGGLEASPANMFLAIAPAWAAARLGALLVAVAIGTSLAQRIFSTSCRESTG